MPAGEEQDREVVDEDGIEEQVEGQDQVESGEEGGDSGDDETAKEPEADDAPSGEGGEGGGGGERDEGSVAEDQPVIPVHGEGDAAAGSWVTGEGSGAR